MANSRPSLVERSAPGRPTVAADRTAQGLAVLVVALSVGFFCAVTVIAAKNPGYFERLLVAAMNDDVDPIETGSTEKADTDGVAAIPVPQVVRRQSLRPSDFQIVMVFGDEAHLSSPGELWRVRAGTVVPGLGRILSVEPGASGGIVRAENATLKGVRTAP